MKFVITRTSIQDDSAPCKGAFKGQYLRIDTRTCKTFEEYDERIGKNRPWLSEGTNHRLVNEGIARDMEMTDAWFVEINTLEDLLILNAEEGQIVIGHCYDNKEVPQIEIYDDYRE
jgi:hypothetical protein